MNKKKYIAPTSEIYPVGRPLLASESLPQSDETVQEEEQLSKPGVFDEDTTPFWDGE